MARRTNRKRDGLSNENDSNSGSDQSSLRADEEEGIETVIRARAYELYLERGSQPGDEVDDWVRAEREYRERHAADIERHRGFAEPAE